MKFSFLLTLIAMMFGGLSCDSPGAKCCDCLIENSCWTSSSYTCYYYYDDNYDGETESPPPAQSWYSECEKKNCSDICEEIL